MENDENVSKSSLIPLLIKYQKCIGKTFPISKVKHLTTDIIIERLRECIDNNIRYESEYIVYNDRINNKSDKNEDKKELISDDDLRKIISLIKMSMNQINYDYELDYREILDIIDLKEHNKKEFTFSEHLRALVISLLSNYRWGDSNIRDNRYKIDSIFHNYDRNYLKEVDYNILVEQLKKIHCSNPMIKKQMESLSYNINILEKIESEYGCLDEFVNSNLPNDIANWFNEGKYKLKQVGRAFTFDYLKRVGVNTCKSSSSIQRLFGYNRLGLVLNDCATEGQALALIKQLSDINGISEIEVESILNQFCLLRSSNICGIVPNCSKCLLRNICKYDKN